MKKVLLNAFTLAILSTGYSQISITKQLFDQYNDTTVTFGVSNANEINIGTNGTNGQWDVSNAIIVTPTVGVFKAYNTAIPGASNFPSATHYSSVFEINADGSLSTTDSYGFATINNSGEEFWGTYGEQELNGQTATVLLKYAPAQKLLTFPFNHQNKVEYNTERTTHIENGGIDDIKAPVVGSYTYEGYGKVKYPGDDVYTNCARMRRIETSTSVIEVGVTGFSSKSTTKIDIDQTDFISEEFKTFALIKTTVTSTSVTTIGGVEGTPQTSTQTSTSATYGKGTSKSEIKQIALGMKDEQYFTSIKLFPNPTTEKISFSNAADIISAEIISSNGTSEAVENLDNVQIKGEKGLYLVKLTLRNGASKSYKVVKN